MLSDDAIIAVSKAAESWSVPANTGLELAGSFGGMFKGVSAEGLAIAANGLGIIGDVVKGARNDWQDAREVGRSVRKLQLVHEAMEKVKVLGYEGKVTPADESFTEEWLDKAPLQDDETLRDMWINLLISASLKDEGTHPAFTKILTSISSKEALLLKHYQGLPYGGVSHLCDKATEQPDWATLTNDIVSSELGSESDLGIWESKALYENLEREKLIEIRIFEVKEPRRTSIRSTYDPVYPTKLTSRNSSPEKWIAESDAVFDDFGVARNDPFSSLNHEIKDVQRTQKQHRIYLTAFGRQFMEAVSIDDIKQT